MQTDRMVLRPRTQAEAMDLGLQLARTRWPALCALTLVGLTPILLVAGLIFIWMPPLALLTVWWFLPSLDRPLLHLLAQDLVGRPVGVHETLRDPAGWWTGGHLTTLLFHRFNWARSAVLPIWQLERLSGPRRRQRASALAHGNSGSGAGLTLMAITFQLCLLAGLVALLAWLVPASAWQTGNVFDWFEPGQLAPAAWALLTGCYVATVILVEPFYVGAGFGLYLNQRCRLECWDLEPELQRIGQRHGPTTAVSAA